MNLGSADQVLCRKMALFLSSCWFFLTDCLLYLVRYLFRRQIENDSQKDDSSCGHSHGNRDEILRPLITSRCLDSAPEVMHHGFGERDTPSFSFKFHFQSPEDIRKIIEECEVTNDITKATTNLHKHCFQSEKDFAGFIEEPEIASFHVRESYVAPEDVSSSRKEVTGEEYRGKVALNNDFRQLNSVTGDPLVGSREVSESEKSEAEILSKGNVHAKELFVNSEINASDEKDYCGFDSDPESITFSDGLSLKNQAIDSNSEECQSDTEFCGFQNEAVTRNCRRSEILVSFDEEKEEQHMGVQKTPETQLKNSCVSDAESIDYSDGFIYVDDQVDVYKLYLSDTESMDLSDGSPVTNRFNDLASSNEELSENDLSEHTGNLEDMDREDAESELEDFPTSGNSDIENSGTVEADDTKSKFLSEEDFECKFDRTETEQNDELREANTTSTSNLQNPSTSVDSEDMDGLESLWEHQDLIEQLRMELRKVRAIGLPTILEEECGSPRTIEDLRPLRIDGKFLQEDAMDELHKLYKSYRERMRKFDILNYQKMYAIGFLQLKDPLQQMGRQKSSTSLLSHNLRRVGRQKYDMDPSKKFIIELQSNLETIYVGQACLSWEFLYWQYEKMRKLSKSDSDPPQGSCCQYNRVAGEFQQFQVLLQRFLENEPFQGPRVQNYVKSRFDHRNLLQVPAIKEDSLNDIKEESSGNGAITREVLMDIMEKSIRIFWDFVKADRKETNVNLKEFLGAETEVQDPTDLELLTDIRADLQKKEKKLKDLLRTGFSLVKRFQKHQEEKSDQLMFFAQLDMKLISRVLRMTKITTDQLVWCHKKLDKITFPDRKIHREPSFYLFPC